MLSFCSVILCMLDFQFCASYLMFTKWLLHILTSYKLSKAEERREEPSLISRCNLYISLLSGEQEVLKSLLLAVVTCCEEGRESDFLGFPFCHGRQAREMELRMASWVASLQFLPWLVWFLILEIWKYTVLPEAMTEMVCRRMTRFHHWIFCCWRRPFVCGKHYLQLLGFILIY